MSSSPTSTDEAEEARPRDGTHTPTRSEPPVPTTGPSPSALKAAKTPSPKSSLARLKLDKFGIDKMLEHHHDRLSKKMPIYKKISSVLIPPIQASIDLISPPEPDAETHEKAPDSEDADVIVSFGDHRNASSFLSMLATATVCSGMSSLRAMGGYNTEQTQADELPASPQTSTDTMETAIPDGASADQLGDASKPSEEVRDLHPEPVFKAHDLVCPPRQNFYPTDILQKIYSGKGVKMPPAHLRSPWENSVIDRMELYEVQNHAILRSAEDDEFSLSDTNTDLQNLLLFFTARKLGETFDLDDDNILYGRFDVWLIRDVMLQGHIHITRDAIFFYALLPGEITNRELKDSELPIYSGALGHKVGNYIDSFFPSVYAHRYWAVLKQETLSLYSSSTELYFPVKVVDLRNALYCEISKSATTTVPADGMRSGPVSADPIPSPDSSEVSSLNEDEETEENVKSGVWFKIVSKDKVHRFHTSSIYSARHWYNCITKVIFQIRNTNSQREVLVKIPIEDILDCHKNFVLADPDSMEPDSDGSDETPTTIILNYSLPVTKGLQNLRHMKKNSKEPEPDQDTVHFVTFFRGQELSDTIERALDDHVTTNLENSTFNQKIKQRAKRLFKDDASTTTTRKAHDRNVTTLQPDSHTHTSIVERIAEVNKELQNLRDEFAKGDAEAADTNDCSKLDGPWTKLMNMRNKFLPVLDSDRSMMNEPVYAPEDDYAIAPDGDFDGAEWNYNLQFPRPFSLRDLKGLDLLLVKRRRKLRDVALQYSELSAKAEREIFLSENSANMSAEDLHSTSQQTSTMDEPPQLETQPKKSKLSSFKKRLQNMTAVSGVFPVEPEHYLPSESDDEYYVSDLRDRVKRINHFRKHFSLGPETNLIATYSAHLRRSSRAFGRIYLGNEQLCFRSLIPGVSTKMILPLKDITRCEFEKGTFRSYGLVIKGKGMGELVFDFGNLKARDDIKSLLATRVKSLGSAGNLTDGDAAEVPVNKESHGDAKYFDDLAAARVKAARLRLLEDRVAAASGIEMPLILEDNPFKATEVMVAKSYKITLLTIGSRGDVQPYIALGKALVKEGNQVTIATHAEFKDWCESHGLKFREVAGNPAELMQLMVTHGSMSVAFLKEASTKFRGWINELLASSWEACKDSDLLIESPSAMAGLHIAETLNIPYMRAFTMPWTRTRAYPHAFIVPDQKRGGPYNYMTHVMFENVFWKGISGQVNKWRVETLGIPKTSLAKMQQSRFPFLYNISPSMFPPSVDFPDWVKVTGYWYLDEGSTDYSPPEGLQQFLQDAKAKNEKIIYIGFGSIVVSDANLLTRTINDAVQESGVKCILNKGWSDKLSKSEGEDEVELCSQIYNTGSVPHDWLFPQVDAAIHHGGSGTTGATLRAGLPTVIKPFFGDQFFYASRIEDLGVGVALKNINKKSLVKVIKAVVTEVKYRDKASAVAKAMRHERGVSSAIEAIYSELAYAKSLMASVKSTTEAKKHTEDRSGAQTPAIEQQALNMVKGDKTVKYEGTVHY